MSDREPCVVCGHSLGSHDGEPPYKCMYTGCGCPVFVPQAALSERERELVLLDVIHTLRSVARYIRNPKITPDVQDAAMLDDAALMLEVLLGQPKVTP